KTFERRDVSVSLGQHVDLRIQLEVGGVAERVDVTGTGAPIDTSSTTSGAVIDTDVLMRVPVSRRVTDTPSMVPGVSNSGTAGAANPSISGGSGLDNRYLLDGADLTNVGFGAFGAYSRVHG